MSDSVNSKRILSLTEELLEVADKLDGLHRTVNKVHVAGNTASAVGSAAALAGIFAAPLTGGASLALTVGSLAGGIASGGASIHQQTAEICAMKTMYHKVEDFVEEIDSPVLWRKYGKLLRSLLGVLKNMKRIISAGGSFSSSKVPMTPDQETVINITAKSATGIVTITATGREISKVSFTVAGNKAAKVLADATGKEAVKLVEKVTGKVVLKASVQFAGKKTALVTGEVIGKASQAARNTKSVRDVSAQRAAQGSQNMGKFFGAATALFGLGLSLYGAATAAHQLINNKGSQGGNYLREIASLLEEFASQP